MNGDVGIQEAVQFLHKTRLIQGVLLRVEMSDETGCVNPRVRPSGAGHGNRLPAHGAQGKLERLLNTFGIGLNLPAMETGSMIGKFDKITSFQNNSLR